MALQSQLFKGDQRLESCLIHDSAHITQGAAGDYVAKIQKALSILDDAKIDSNELSSRAYGPSTATVVLAYKKQRKIINQSYQTQADNIVGKMTIAAMDKEILEVRLVPTSQQLRYHIATAGRIANVESGFHQFEADPGTTRIVPKFNFGINAQGGRGRGDGGAGICQITPPSADEIWDWKANVKKGKQILAGARGAAVVYLNQHTQNGQFTNDLGLVDAEVVLREAIQNFNGCHFWQWNAAANRWEARPPNTYVDSVLNATP
jgi:hypothetical protein